MKIDQKELDRRAAEADRAGDRLERRAAGHDVVDNHHPPAMQLAAVDEVECVPQVPTAGGAGVEGGLRGCGPRSADGADDR